MKNPSALLIARRMNSLLEKLMPLLTSSGVVLGFLFPGVFIWLRPIVLWLFAINTLSGALKLRTSELKKALYNPAPILLYFFISHVFMPLMVFFLAGLIFRGESDAITGFVLLYAMPTAITALIWVSIHRGDSALGFALILLATFGAPLIVPGTVYLLLGARVRINMTSLVISLFIMVVIPTVIGVASNEISKGKIPIRLSPYIDPLAKMLMILITAINVSAAAPQIKLDSLQPWIIAFAWVFFSVISYLSSYLCGILARFSPEKKTSFLFIASMKNSAAAATIAIAFFPEAAAQPAIFGMLLQQLTAAFMGKILLKQRAS